jgi:hypothetical protein
MPAVHEGLHSAEAHGCMYGEHRRNMQHMGKGKINNVNKPLFSCGREMHNYFDQAFRVRDYTTKQEKGYHVIMITIIIVKSLSHDLLTPNPSSI